MRITKNMLNGHDLKRCGGYLTNSHWLISKGLVNMTDDEFKSLVCYNVTPPEIDPNWVDEDGRRKWPLALTKLTRIPLIIESTEWGISYRPYCEHGNSEKTYVCAIQECYDQILHWRKGQDDYLIHWEGIPMISSGITAVLTVDPVSVPVKVAELLHDFIEAAL